MNTYAFGKQILRLPREDFSAGKIPKAFFMTREIYERLLRRLVLGRSKRIRWQVATAIGLCVSPDDCRTVSSVKIRTTDGVESDVPVTLFIGTLLSAIIDYLLIVTPRLHGRDSGGLQMAAADCERSQLC